LLAVVFWVAHYAVLMALNPIYPEQTFLLQTGLTIVSGIFLIRALFNALTIADHLTKSLNLSGVSSTAVAVFFIGTNSV